MLSQPQAIQAAAEHLVENAKILGEACRITPNMAAATIIEVALGMAVADMVGPATEDRLVTAMEIIVEKVITNTAHQHFFRHGVRWDRDRLTRLLYIRIFKKAP